MNSCLYVGTVRHRRFAPTPHAFATPLFMTYLDLDELPGVFDGRWLWSARGPALAWFRRADYLGDPTVPLAEAVRDEAERLTGSRPAGAIRMLTHLRYLGYVMNPVTFYYCHDADGAVEVVLAQITNTPWGERHVYAVGPDGRDDQGRIRRRFGKAFHVSPFMPMDQRYDWSFTTPGRSLVVHMESATAGGVPVFDATLALRRRPMTAGTLAGALVRFPWMTGRVVGAIYWQAARLRLKRVPVHPHPDHHAA